MTLDSPTLAERWRPYDVRRPLYERRKAQVHPRLVQDIHARNLRRQSRVSDMQQPNRAIRQSQPAQAPAHPNTETSRTCIANTRGLLRPKPADLPNRTMRSLVLARANLVRPGRKRSRTPRRSALVTTVVVLLCALGVAVGLNGFMTDRQVAAQVRHLSAQAASSTSTTQDADPIPSETKPAVSLKAYTVAPTMPRELTIPSIGVDTRVVQVGTLKNGALATPNNIFDAGWYSASSKPGEPGAELIDDHVSGPTQHGVFYNLKLLKAGDKITVQRGDGQIFTYTVVTTKTYDANNVDMAAALTPITPGKPGLNLITCTGKLDSSGTHFLQRVVVFASI